jgi:hypothetical protein
MKIIFDVPRTTKLVPEKIIPEQVFSYSSVTILKMFDLPNEREVKVQITEPPFFVVLWSGDDYDMIGDWTNQDVADRLGELFPPTT